MRRNDHRDAINICINLIDIYAAGVDIMLDIHLPKFFETGNTAYKKYVYCFKTWSRIYLF